MDTDEKVIQKHSELILRACSLLEEQARMIRAGAKNTLEDAAFRIFLERSIRVYIGTLRYLAAEVLRTDESIYPYLLPNVRTLQDVYARFLHLISLSGDEKNQALTCAIYQLQSVSKHMGGGEYATVYALYHPMIEKYNIPVPNNPALFDFKEFRKMSITFPPKNETLTEEKIHQHSVHVVKNFGVKLTYRLYSYFSESLHGNPYTFAEGGGNNQRFWVISLTLINTALLIELVDRYVLSRGQSRDAREWFKDLLAERDSLTKAWVARRTAAE